MKKLFLLFVFMYGINTMAQQFIIANPRQNVVYCGVDNQLLAMIAGHSCKSVILTTNNGEIEKTSCGLFNYKPLNIGETNIVAWIRIGKKLKRVGDWKFRCKRLPLPVAFVGIKNGGDISLEQFLIQQGVRVSIIDYEIDAPFQVINYTISAIRENKNLFIENNTGAQYNLNVLQRAHELKVDDHLIISNIKIVGPDNIERILAPLEFIIKE